MPATKQETKAPITTIETLTNKVVRGGKLVTDTFYIVVDAEGNLLGNKQYTTEAEAKAAQGELQYIAEGMEFVNATTPDLAAKAKVGKAKIVAAYLQWIADGKPVAEALADEEQAEEETEQPTDEAGETEADDDDF